MSVQTKGSIWLVADRRLSYEGRPPKNNAIKATIVDTTDGIALLGYAGLGETGRGNQPSQWVSNALRGRAYPLKQMLQVVSDAMQREFPPHIGQIKEVRRRNHSFLIPAFVENEPHVFTIALTHTPSGYNFAYARGVMEPKSKQLNIVTPLTIVGSGEVSLRNRVDWQRPTLSLVKAYNRKKISAYAVADHLASLAYFSHKNTIDPNTGERSVGPDCVVIWRNSKIGLHGGGGMHSFYSHGNRKSDSATVPWINNGSDTAALFTIIKEEVMPDLRKMVQAEHRGEPIAEFDKDRAERAMNEKLSKLPSNPDEKLR